MNRVPIQVDVEFKQMLDRVRHKFCIEANRNISQREFTKILLKSGALEQAIKNVKNNNLLK